MAYTDNRVYSQTVSPTMHHLLPFLLQLLYHHSFTYICISKSCWKY